MCAESNSFVKWVEQRMANFFSDVTAKHCNALHVAFDVDFFCVSILISFVRRE